MSNYNNLKDRHKDCMAHIVGKGPSLAYLTNGHFNRHWSIAIALNDAISIVQELGLTIPIYSLQKDGKPEFMVRPRSNIPLILQKDYSSETYYLNHRERYLVHPIEDLGFNHTGTMAIQMAIAIARFMGCSRMVLLCCDNLVNANELRTFNPRSGAIETTAAAEWYEKSREQVLDDLKDMPHEFITPT